MPYTGSNVDGHVVVITGGGTGIGAAIAARYAAEGARVVILGRRPGPLEAVADDIGALPLVADAGDPRAVKEALAAVLNRFGRVDTLVCNAGGPGFTPVGGTSDADWAEALHANLTTSFAIAREFLPALIDSSGRIVIIIALRALRWSLYGRIRHRQARPDRPHPVPRATVTADLPLARSADPAEVAAAVRFLGSDESSYITGATLVVDGGAHTVDLPTLAFEKARARKEGIPTWT